MLPRTLRHLAPRTARQARSFTLSSTAMAARKHVNLEITSGEPVLLDPRHTALARLLRAVTVSVRRRAVLPRMSERRESACEVVVHLFRLSPSC